jgi:hypothetical protein
MTCVALPVVHEFFGRGKKRGLVAHGLRWQLGVRAGGSPLMEVHGTSEAYV